MRKAFGILIIIGIINRLYFASFETRVWIDEIWVVFTPAYKLLTGAGPVERDWFWKVRDWIPPGIMFLVLKTLSILGIKNGPMVHHTVRVIITTATAVSFISFSFLLRRLLGLKHLPWISLIVLFFIPELIHYSSTGDLSVLATPPLLMGFTLYFWDKKQVTLTNKAGTFLIYLAALIRFQYFIFPASFFIIHLVNKQKKAAFQTAFIGLLVLAADIAFNSYLYGSFAFPLFNYFMVNTTGGVASSYGTSSFFHGLEIFWRFATEPVFLLIVLFSVYSVKKIPQLAIPSYLFLVIHLFIPHKEFRFFYGAVVILSAIAASAFQRYLEQDKKPPITLARYASPVMLASFLVLFSFFALYRGIKKVDFKAFQIPAELEALAGEQSDTKGLITFGWGGIFLGCNYTYYRPLHCIFGENADQVKTNLAKNGLLPGEFTHVVMPENEPVKTTLSFGLQCDHLIMKKNGGALYKCR